MGNIIHIFPCIEEFRDKLGKSRIQRQGISHDGRCVYIFLEGQLVSLNKVVSEGSFNYFYSQYFHGKYKNFLIQYLLT